MKDPDGYWCFQTSIIPIGGNNANESLEEVKKCISKFKAEDGKKYKLNIGIKENELEIKREEIKDTDLVITIRELSDYLKNTKINFAKIKNVNFDSGFGRGSGAGLIFGASGGVMEAALRTAYFYETGKSMKSCNITGIRGYNGVKETSVTIGGRTLNVAAIDELKNAIPILESIKNGTCKYDYIEIMNCRGGCIGGGGQPAYKLPEEAFVKEKRIESLYKRDDSLLWRNSYENKYIKKLYKDYLEYPGSKVAHELLHTSCLDRSSEKNIKLKRM